LVRGFQAVLALVIVAVWAMWLGWMVTDANLLYDGWSLLGVGAGTAALNVAFSFILGWMVAAARDLR
jgi:hypothetical protein